MRKSITNEKKADETNILINKEAIRREIMSAD